MWYNREHENTSLHPTFDRKRTRPDPNRLTLERRLCLAAQPSPAGIRAWRTSPRDSQPIGLPPANGPQHHPRLQYEAAGGVARMPTRPRPMVPRHAVRQVLRKRGSRMRSWHSSASVNGSTGSGTTRPCPPPQRGTDWARASSSAAISNGLLSLRTPSGRAPFRSA